MSGIEDHWYSERWITLMSGPFSLTNNMNFSAGHRTRVILFMANFELFPGEKFPKVVILKLTNQQNTVFNLPVEYVGKVDGFDWLTAVVVRLDEQVTDVGDLNISLLLRGVDFEARLGELTFIVGPSGCGKTTLLSVITGLLDPPRATSNCSVAMPVRCRPISGFYFAAKTSDLSFSNSISIRI